MTSRHFTALSLALPFAVSVLALSSTAHADVRREGDWSSNDPSISLSLRDISQRNALMKLADEAGWSLIVPSGLEESIDLKIKGMSASKVLDMVLDEGRFVAKRDGTMIRIRRDDSTSSTGAPSTGNTASTGTTTASPSASDPGKIQPAALPLAPIARGEDRHYTGQSIVIRSGEITHDVSVLGGNLTIDGTATGNVEVLGGNVTIHRGAVVLGRVSTLGGNVKVDEGARVDGEVRAVGGKVNRNSKETSPASFHLDLDDHDLPAAPSGGVMSTLSRAASDTGKAISSAAMLFVFGAVLLALTTRRMDEMKFETAARPMRTFALGIVGALVALIVTVATCITVIGIPVAVVAILTALLATYAGVCAVLQTGGEILLRHRTANPYIHLAAGCAMFLALGALPWVGGWVQGVVMFSGFGAAVALGLRVRNERRGQVFAEPGPYRSSHA